MHAPRPDGSVTVDPKMPRLEMPRFGMNGNAGRNRGALRVSFGDRLGGFDTWARHGCFGLSPSVELPAGLPESLARLPSSPAER
jgi:hypothetical protein